MTAAAGGAGTLEANGLRIGYDELGGGPPMLLLHGATSSGREDFAAQLPALATAFRCIVPDARAHGRTRWDVEHGFEAAWLVDDVLGIADVLGLPTFHLLGFSMGAMTALQLATRHPDRLRTLVVAGITPAREPRATLARHVMDPARIEREDPEWAARLAARHDTVQGPGAWRRLLPAIAADVAVQPLLSPAELRTVDPPTLVIAGDRDPFVPADHAWRLARQVRAGRLLIVPDAGHEVFARQPAIVNEALAWFYRATADQAAERAERGAKQALARAVRASSAPVTRTGGTR